MSNTQAIIEDFAKSVEVFINKEISLKFNISIDRYNKVKCSFLYPNSLRIQNHIEIQFSSFRRFKSKLINFEFIVDNQSVQILSNAENSKLFIKFLLDKEIFNKTFIFDFILKSFEKYVFDYVKFVEKNISSIVSQNLNYIKESNLNFNLFEEPKFIVKSVSEMNISYRYKAGEGYCESTSENISYKIEPNKNNDIELDEEIFHYLEKKRKKSVYYEDGYSFHSNTTNSSYYNESLDINLTRFLINFSEKRIDSLDKEFYFNNKFKSLTKRHLYFYTYIIFCDLEEYFKTFRHNPSDDGFLYIKTYYHNLYYITQFIYDIDNHNPKNLFDNENFNDFLQSEIPEFDFIKDNVVDFFGKEIDTYFNNFLINVNEKFLEKKIIFAVLKNFFKSLKK